MASDRDLCSVVCWISGNLEVDERVIPRIQAVYNDVVCMIKSCRNFSEEFCVHVQSKLLFIIVLEILDRR